MSYALSAVAVLQSSSFPLFKTSCLPGLIDASRSLQSVPPEATDGYVSPSASVSQAFPRLSPSKLAWSELAVVEQLSLPPQTPSLSMSLFESSGHRSQASPYESTSVFA